MFINNIDSAPLLISLLSLPIRRPEKCAFKQFQAVGGWPRRVAHYYSYVCSLKSIQRQSPDFNLPYPVIQQVRRRIFRSLSIDTDCWNRCPETHQTSVYTLS